MITTKTLVFVVVCLCLQGVHSSNNPRRTQEETVAERLKRAVPAPAPRFQAAGSDDVARAEADAALAIIHTYDAAPIDTPEQRLRVLELQQAHEAILARERARQRELRSSEFEHELHLQQLERQRDAVLAHVRTVAQQLAEQQGEVEQASSSSTGGVLPPPDASSSSTGSVSTPPDDSSSSTGSPVPPGPESSSTATPPPDAESSSTVTPAPADESSSTGGGVTPAPESSSTGGVTPAPESSSTGGVTPAPESSSTGGGTTGGSVTGGVTAASSTVDDTSNENATSSTGPKPRFVPGFIDHDPFAKGQVFESGTAESIDWPSPIADESDPVDVVSQTQPTGGFYTPEVLPPVADTTSPATGSTATQWVPVETTTSSILPPQASEVSWRWKQKLRRQRGLTPSDDEGNMFSLLQTQATVRTEDEFSAKHLAQEQTDLLAQLKQMDKTKPGWL